MMIESPEPIYDKNSIIYWKYCNLYYCPCCFKEYKNQSICESHYMKKCNLLDNEKRIANKDNLEIIMVLPKNISKLCEIGYNLSYFAKKERGDDFRSISSNENPDEIILYYLIINKVTIGYLIFRKQEVDPKCNKDFIWVLWDVFIFKEFRGRGIGDYFISKSLNSLGFDYETAIYLWPISKYMKRLLYFKIIKVDTFNGYIRGGGSSKFEKNVFLGG